MDVGRCNDKIPKEIYDRNFCRGQNFYNVSECKQLLTVAD